MQVAQRLDMHPVSQEIFAAANPPALETCRAKLDECDIFVLLMAYRYGSRPPGETRSYTEWEYDRAVAIGKPVYAFIIRDNFPWPPDDVDHGAEAEALAAFRAKVQSHTRARFGDPAELREEVWAALSEAKRELLSSHQEAGVAGRSDTVPDPRARVIRTHAPAITAFPEYIGGAAEFTGRLAELAALDDWAKTPDRPVYVLEAIGGTGKSALAWQWFTTVPAEQLAGRFWWSFYEGSTSVTSLCREFLAYARGTPPEDIDSLDPRELVLEVVKELRAGAYLLGLDGLERLCFAYHRIDPTKVTDEELDDAAADQRRLVDASAYHLITSLLTVEPSKVLVSTRLTPDAFLAPGGFPRPGLIIRRLPGLTPEDACMLVHRHGVRGSDESVRTFFAHFDNHPLMIALVAGIVLNDRRNPGDFDRWANDPIRGGRFTLQNLSLTVRRSHILAASLDGVPAEELAVLQALSVLAEPVTWELLLELNPHRPAKPEPVVPDLGPLGPRPEQKWVPEGPAREAAWAQALAWDAEARRLTEAAMAESARIRQSWAESEAVARADAQLDSYLSDLEQRGLLWWDRARNTYDMHPVVRAYVYATVDEEGRRRANTRVADYFGSRQAELPPEPKTVDDLLPAITLFRALVATGQNGAAARHYNQRLSGQLELLGANSTIIELLSSFGTELTDLANAYYLTDRTERAVEIHARLLATNLSRRIGQSILVDVNNLIGCYQAMGRLATAQAGIDLMARIVAATGRLPGDLARLKSLQVEQATLLGRYEEAWTLLAELDTLPPSPTKRHYRENKLMQRIVLVVATQEAGIIPLPELTSLAGNTEARIVGFGDLVSTFDEWANRATCARFWAEFARGTGDWAELQVAAEQWRALLHSGGVEATRAETYLAMAAAGLGRIDEAGERITNVIAALPRSEQHARPYLEVAETLVMLGHRDQAGEYALRGYQAVHRDGPDYERPAELRRASAVLASLGIDSPQPEPVIPLPFPHAVEIEAYIAFHRTPDLATLEPWIIAAARKPRFPEAPRIPFLNYDGLHAALGGDSTGELTSREFSEAATPIFEILVGRVMGAQDSEFDRLVFDSIVNGVRPDVIDRWIQEYAADYRRDQLREGLRRSHPDWEESQLELYLLRRMWLDIHRQNYREITRECWELFVAAIFDAVEQRRREQ